MALTRYKRGSSLTSSFTGTANGTDTIELRGGFNISISGTWTGEVVLQRSFDGGSTFHDYETWTANTETKDAEVQDGVVYRWRGAVASGTATCYVGQ